MRISHRKTVPERVSAFLPSPFSWREPFTGKEGRYVPVEDTIKGFEAILGGELDEYP